jgi:hypothetical protein
LDPPKPPAVVKIAPASLSAMAGSPPDFAETPRAASSEGKSALKL